MGNKNNKNWKDELAKFGNPQEKIVQNTVQNENRAQNTTAYGNENHNYVGAPYNFIPFTPTQYEYPKEQLPMHNMMNEELISGEIGYEITAETDIFVDDGTDAHHFYKNAKGQYSIPGSSMRGLFRTNVQILGFSSFDDDIDEYALMYRNVAGSTETNKDEYTAIIGDSQLITLGKDPEDDEKEVKVNVLNHVKAGYICKEKGQYYIYKTCDMFENKQGEERNYYVLSERIIIGEYKKYKKQAQTGKFPFDFFVQNDKYLQNTEEYDENKSYKPYYEKVSYKANQQIVTSVRKPKDGKAGDAEGYVISSGYIRDKKVIYIIPAIDRSKEPILVSNSNVESFKADFEKKKTTLGNKKVFFDLPEEGEIKPVFYIGDGEKLYFGFTPRLRVFYEHTIKDGLYQSQKEGTIDFAKAMFGYSKNQESYKSRISFSDAVVNKSDIKECDLKRVILSEPKPTSYLDYLNQKKDNKDTKKVTTYNSADFQLRGVKQYWLHQEAYDNVPVSTNTNEKVKTIINALPANTKFIGTVRFKNLTELELGLLLWAIRLEKGSQMNIGKAKAYGYGRVSVEIKRAKQINLQKSYRSTQMLELDPFDDIAIDAEIDHYKEFLTKKLQELGKQGKSGKPETNSRISGFLSMKNFAKAPSAENVRYMNLKEYTKRKNSGTALPRINEVINKNK